MVERSKALQIYFKPGLSEDDLMLRVWKAARRRGRPQEIFRSMLREGLVQLVANGKLDESIIEECGLDAIVERRRQRTAKHSDRPAPSQVPVPQGYAPPVYHGYPVPAAPIAPSYVDPSHYPQQHPAPRPYEPETPAPMRPPAEKRPEPPPERDIEQRITPSAPMPDKGIAQDPPPPSDGAKPGRKLGKLM